MARQDKKRSGETARNFHKILKVLLKPLLDVQEDGIPNFSYRIGDRIKVVTLLVPLFFVLADGQESDKCAARKLYYTDVVRICSGCDCHYDDSDKVDVKCEFLEVALIRDLSEIALNHRDAEQRDSAKNQLADNYYEHAVDNAFFDFKYLGGGSAHGIFGALPPCFSHTVQEGVFKYVIQAFFQLVTKTILYEIDLLAMELLSVCPRQSHRSNFPRCSFTHGISRTAKLTCTEQTGLLFTLSILIATDRCRELIHSRLKRKQQRKKKKDEEEEELTEAEIAALEAERVRLFLNGGGCDNLSKLFTALLGFQAWTKKRHFWTADRSTPEKVTEAGEARAAAQTSIKEMIKMLKTALPRQKGNGWKLQKVHNLLHFVTFIDKFGSVRNFDTACCEKNHKWLSKCPACTAQKKHGVFLPQTAERVTDHLTIRRACSRVGILPDKRYRENMSFVDDDDQAEEINLAAMFDANHIGNAPVGPVDHKNNELVGAKFKLVKVTNHPIRFLHWWNGSKDWVSAKHEYDLWEPYRNFVLNKFSDYPVIHGFTEVQRKGITFRSHPNYRRAGPWIDWCTVNYEPMGNVPSKIVGFVLAVTHVNGNAVPDSAGLWEDDDPPPDSELVDIVSLTVNENGTRHESKLTGEVHAVIHTCDSPRLHERSDTEFMDRWDLEYDPETKEPVLRCVPLRSIVSPIFVVEEFPGIHEIKPKSAGIYHIHEMHTWASKFTEPDN